MAKVELKQPIVEAISEEIKDAQSVVLVDYRGLTELSKIPSREELLSKLLGSMQSPITNFARVIKQIAEKQEA